MTKTTLSKLIHYLTRADAILKDAIQSQKKVSGIERLQIIFGILFLKRASDLFEEKHQQLIQCFIDEGLPEEDAWKEAENPDLYCSNNRESLSIFIPPDYRWNKIRAEVHDCELGHLLNVAFQAIADAVPHHLKDTLHSPDFNSVSFIHHRRGSYCIAQLIENFTSLPLRNEDLAYPGLVGVACRTFMHGAFDFSSAAVHGLPTTISVASLMVRILNPGENTEIVDPCVGLGTLLSEAASHINAQGGSSDQSHFCGYELNFPLLSICNLNLLLQDLSSVKTYKGDSLEDLPLTDGKLKHYDFVLGHPPFGTISKQHFEAYWRNLHDRFPYGVSSTFDMLFAQQMISLLKPKGLMVVLVPQSSLSRRYRRDEKIRQAFMEDDHIEAVINLPPNLLLNTAVPPCLLVMRPRGAKSLRKKGSVLFINAEAEYEKERYKNVLRPAHVEKIASTYHSFTIDKRFQSIPNYAAEVCIEEIQANNYNLDPKTYVICEASLQETKLTTIDKALKGIPQSEIDAKLAFFAAYGFDPTKKILSECKGLRPLDKKHYDFYAEIVYRDDIKVWIDKNLQIRQQEARLRDAVSRWWKDCASTLLASEPFRPIAELRSQLCITFEEATKPIGVISPISARGILADWWEGDFLRPTNIQLLAKLGFRGLIRHLINERFNIDDPYISKIAQKLLPTHLHELSEVNSRINELSKDLKEIEEKYRSLDKTSEKPRKYSAYLKQKVKREKEIILEKDQALKILNKNLLDLESQDVGATTLNKIIADLNNERDAAQQALLKIKEEVSHCRAKEIELKELRKNLKTDEKTLSPRMKAAVESLSSEGIQALSLDIVYHDCLTHLNLFIMENQKSLVSTLESWWNSYHIGIEEIDSFSLEDLLHYRGIGFFELWRYKHEGERLSLAYADLSRSNLSGVDLSNTDLSYANLENACLRSTNLKSSDLSNANLSGADLRDSNMSLVQAISTDFSCANLSGACIKDWNINVNTNLENIVCDYIYLSAGKKERRPSDRERLFSADEFSTLVRSTLTTIDLIFQDGIDWTAFSISFQQIQHDYAESDIAIQGIERKGGAFIVHLEVDDKADKSAIEAAANRLYSRELALVEDRYKVELQAKETELQIYRQQNTNFLELTHTLASIRPTINIKAEAVTNQSQSSSDRTINIGDGTYREINLHDQSSYAEGDYINASQSKQSLSEAASEIQHLLEQLSNTYNTDTTSGKMRAATETIDLIEKDHKLAERILSAIKTGGVAAFEQFLNHPASSFVIGALEDWQKTKVKKID